MQLKLTSLTRKRVDQMKIFLYSSLTLHVYTYACIYATIVKFNNTYVESFVNDIFILRNYENDIHILPFVSIHEAITRKKRQHKIANNSR